MKLPVMPPVAPMLAKRVRDFPDLGSRLGKAEPPVDASRSRPEPEPGPEPGLLFEPKWDGFRAIIFRDGDEVYIQSRDEKPLDRYFPELRAPILASLPERCVVDGEIVIATPAGLEFGLLQLRLHPAASRIEKLSREIPASFVAFDLLALGDRSLFEVPFAERRASLEQALAGIQRPIHLTPTTRDPELARDWFRRFEGAGFDGVIAKPADLLYEPNKRVMLKIKHSRTADCVVAGFRWHKKGKGELIGSLLLGIYDQDGDLHSVGVTSSFTMEKRRAMLAELEPLRAGARDDHPWGDWANAGEEDEAPPVRRPGMTSRWNRDKDLSFEPLRIERVVEVAYDGLLGDRFRHGTTFVRWRPDKPPRDCTYEQFEVTPPYELEKIFGGQAHSDQGS